MRNRTASIFSCAGRLQATVVFAWVLLMCVSVEAQERTISGVVSDSTGAKIAQAELEVEFSGRTVRTRTDESGKFTLVSTAESGTLTVESPGFNAARIKLDAQSR